MNKEEKKAIGTAFIIEGESYYSSLAQPNNKGQYASNCYEVGIANPKIKISKKTDEAIAEVIKEKFETDFLKANGTNLDDTTEDNTIFVKIKNSKYPIPCYDINGERIEAPRISNGFPIKVKVKLNYSEKYKTYYLTAIGVKLMEEYKPFNPFDDEEDF